MSAAKEIAIVKRSEEHSLNASEEAGAAGQQMETQRVPELQMSLRR
jgi:hypothetical protein